MTLPIWLIILAAVTSAATLWALHSDGPWFMVVCIGVFLMFASVVISNDIKHSEACEAAGGQWIDKVSECVTPHIYEKPK